MTRVADPQSADSGHAWLEVERLEVAGGLLHVTGYWTGIRGRRFVRPTLTFVSDGARHRLLAEIVDKPWPAEEGTSWRARFPWDLGGATVSDVELTVATDIVIPLSSPAGTGRDAPRAGRPGPAAEASKLRRQLKELQDRLDHQRAENERLLDELHTAEKEALDAAAAIARRDSALSKLDEITAELDRAAVMAKEAAAARDHALSERDEAFRLRDDAQRERDRVATELVTAKHDLRSVLDRSESLAQEARRLQVERDQALTPRAGELRVLGPPWREESVSPAAPVARAKPATESAPARAPAPVSPPPPPPRTMAMPAPAPRPPISDGPPAQPSRVQMPVLTNPARRRHELSMRDAGWLPRLGAIALLAAGLIVLALILHVL